MEGTAMTMWGVCDCGHGVSDHMLQDPGYCRWKRCPCSGYVDSPPAEWLAFSTPPRWKRWLDKALDSALILASIWVGYQIGRLWW